MLFLHCDICDIMWDPFLQRNEVKNAVKQCRTASLCKCNIISPHFYTYISHLVKVVNIIVIKIEDYPILLSAMLLFFPSCYTMVSEGDKGAFHVCTAHYLEPNC
jgi:hypothetical protein